MYDTSRGRTCGDTEWLKASEMRASDIESEYRHKQQSLNDDGEGRNEYLELLRDKIAIPVA